MTLGCFLFFTLLPLLYSIENSTGNYPWNTLTDEKVLETKRNFLATNEKLYQHIFSSYNPNLPPVYTKRKENDSRQNQPNKSVILITLMYAKLLELSAPRQLMTVIFEYAMTWVDERLSWDPKEYDDIDHIYVLRNNVWIPEITPFDSLEVVETRPDYKQHVPITYQGVASFYTSVVTSVVCPIDVTFFPFDEQNCSMKLLSYSFYSDEMAMQNEIFKNLQISGVGNDEWEVTNILARSEIRYNASEADQINEFTFFMKRNPSYYVALIIVPSFMLTFLCVAGLFTSPLIVDDLGKFCMGLTTIMSTTVMIGIVAENIPKTKIIPHLTWYVTSNLVIVSLAILLVIILPKITEFLGWACRCRQLLVVRRHSGIWMGVLNALLLIVFEGFVVRNLIDMVVFG
ncbi:hypothetical protein Y032_0782g2321 [Ancylostoma ceylanicum]|uniref:Neurotransmitter-gated ion-channel ligand-binding domain-containing protein n=1 Tax=Ancylostoma ceylanicum TaxID=53326 RepID=A0A016WD85_9BILA|nr:hypothetical protein Y032_0782g2321 [Ancylostoma ceylanicum]